MRIWLAFLGLCSCSVLVDLDGMRGDGADAASEASPVDDAGRCIPRTCESIGANCGPVSDGCGAIIKKGGVESCGTCTGSLTCSAVVPNVCGSPSLYGGKHTKSDCETAGGQARNIGVAGDAGVPQSLCEFTGSACPSGWTRLGNWGSTQPTTGSCGCDPQPCTTSSHAFANLGPETCQTPCRMMNSGNCVPSGSQTVTAKLLTVGCY